MYLMMDYNVDGYVKFLKAFYRMKLYFCYCCCRHMIIDQLRELDRDTNSDGKQEDVCDGKHKATETSLETKQYDPRRIASMSVTTTSE